MRRRGTTLLELMVGSGMLFLMVCMTTTAVVYYLHAYQHYTDKGLRVRQAAKVMETLTQHLRSADTFPFLEGPCSCQAPLLFSERGVGVRALLVDTHGVLQLQELDADHKVLNSTRIGQVQGLTLSQTLEGRERRLHISVQVEASTPLETDVALRGVASL
jgi:hypothetical protein